MPLSEHVGRHLTFHHLWTGRLTYGEEFLPGEIGRFTGQSEQFLDPPGRGRHGGVKIEFSSNIVPPPERPLEGAATGGEILEILRPARAQRMLTLHSEAAPAPASAVTLSQARDRFGDPYAHVEYALSEFDRETYRFGAGLFDRVAAATHAVGADLEPIESVYSGAHHMGTCRMGVGPRDSVVDAQGAVHGVPNLFVAGRERVRGAGGRQPDADDGRARDSRGRLHHGAVRRRPRGGEVLCQKRGDPRVRVRRGLRVVAQREASSRDVQHPAAPRRVEGMRRVG